LTGTAEAVVDAHVHLWDPERLDYPWLAGEPELRRPFGPDDLHTDGHELTAAVFVEAGRVADQAPAEIAWVERIAARWPVLRAAVAHADLERGADVTGDLRRLAASPLVRGVRRNVQDEPDDFAVRPGFVTGTRLLAEHGFTADICVRHRQLPAVLDLVTRVPEVTFVLDHLGKPPVRGDQPATAWRENLRRLAGAPNVVCKLSGLTSEADPVRWQPADVLSYLRFALAEFGPERCMFGSDWPVARLSTSYGRWVQVVVAALGDRPAGDRHHVLRGTALRTYRIASSVQRPAGEPPHLPAGQ
jgi:L-fuconolactonase